MANERMDRLQHNLVVKPSSVTGAGNGVFVDRGRIAKHSVACLYSGDFHPPPPVEAVAAVAAGNIDGGPVALTVAEAAAIHGVPVQLVQQQLENVDAVTSAYQIHCNKYGGYIDAIDGSLDRVSTAFATGHLVNHPPYQVQPNVAPVDFLWDSVLQSVGLSMCSQTREVIERINRIGKGVWFVDMNRKKELTASSGATDTDEASNINTVMLSADCAPLQGLALVALRDIEEGEELFLDYRYDPRDVHLHPDWYHPCK